MNKPNRVEVADVLERAASLIEPEGAWIGGSSRDMAFARDASGHEADAHDEGACSFCLYGAIERAAAGNRRLDIAACQAMKDSVDSIMLADWNHNASRTQSEVAAKLREAAAKAREAASC